MLPRAPFPIAPSMLPVFPTALEITVMSPKVQSRGGLWGSSLEFFFRFA
jgi:hypothetical protein